MTHTDASTLSLYKFAIRTNMLYGGNEQFLMSSDRFYRLMVMNAQCFDDWEPVESAEQLAVVRKDYPYIELIPPDITPTLTFGKRTAEGERVQGQKVHGRKSKK